LGGGDGQHPRLTSRLSIKSSDQVMQIVGSGNALREPEGFAAGVSGSKKIGVVVQSRIMPA
jgi:hypothetical protein